MAYLINSGRDIKCKDFQGGISKLWLLPFAKYQRSQVSVVDMELVLFPSSDYYLFESFGELGINQTMQENEGGKFYNFSFEIKLDGYINIGNFLKKDFRAVALDRNGKTRLFGLWNGLQCESINFTTGSSKTDYSGFALKFDGQEINEAPYLNSINDLQTNFLLQENGDFLLQENLGKFII